LQIADLDLLRATLTVRETKFHMSRCLPLHASVGRALCAHRNARRRLVRHADDAPVFITPAGYALSRGGGEHAFARLRAQLGWRARGG
jgi:hypothetical protein